MQERVSNLSIFRKFMKKMKKIMFFGNKFQFRFFKKWVNFNCFQGFLGSTGREINPEYNPFCLISIGRSGFSLPFPPVR